MALAATGIPVRRRAALGRLDDGMLDLSVSVGHPGEVGDGDDPGTGYGEVMPL